MRYSFDADREPRLRRLTNLFVESPPRSGMFERVRVDFETDGVEADDRFIHLASRMSAHVYEEFEDSPAPVDSFPDEDAGLPVGWWSLLHFLADQQAYSADDEIDAYAEGVRNRLFALVKYHDFERASDRIADLVADLEETREQCEAFAERLAADEA